MIIRFWSQSIIIFLWAFIFAGYAYGQNNVPGRINCVCIDAGHGGVAKRGGDPGAIGAISQEKNITLAVALKVGKLIKEKYPEIKVVYTRTKDVGVDLKMRTKIANDHKADLFISIHTNAFKNKNIRGIETYVLGTHNSEHNLNVAMKENSVIKYEQDYSVKYAGFDPSRAESYIIFHLVQNMHLEKSLDIASLIKDELVKRTKKLDRDVRQAPLWVLKDAAMPATLIEIGYITNPAEERYMNTTEGQNKIAEAIFKGFTAYKTKIEQNCIMLTAKETTEKIPATKGKKSDIPTGKVIYAIQVASAAGKINNTSRLCPGLKINELQSGSRFRYYVHPSQNLVAVKKELPEIRKKIKDCFIIAIYKGKVISLAEAQKLQPK